MRSTRDRRASCRSAVAPLLGRRAKGLAHRRAVGVQQQPFARLRVLQFQQSHGRQLLLARIADAHGDQIVPPAGALERGLETAIEEIAEQKDDGAAMQHAVEVVQPLAQRGAAMFAAGKTARRG